jgi:glycosyltransferase involved in cell wall biosynthesis
MRTLGIVISTPGRQSLSRTLASILYQKTGVEEVLVVGDGFHAATKELVEFYATLGLPCRYQATVKTRDWGHTQVNYGLRHVKGDYVTYQDDDDIYLPRAIEEMVRLVSDFTEPRPLLGRVKTPNFGLLWQRPDATTVLDGHCLVAPNDKRKLGWMAPVHSGDQCLLHTTLRNYSEWAWTNRIWTLTRPSHWSMDVFAGSHVRNDWWWTFERMPHGEPVACLHLWKDPDNDRMFAEFWHRSRDLTRAEVVQIVEFALYACQGNDCWFQFNDADDALLIGALVESNFKEHTRTEYTHDWPPDFWPAVPEFDHVVNPANGERLNDYRDDVWGGRSVS